MRSLNVLNKLLTATIIFTMINLNIAIDIEQARFNITGQQAMAQSTLPKEDRSMSGDGSFKLKNAQESDNDSMARKRQQNSGTYTKEEASGGLGIFNNQLFVPLIMLTIAFLVSKIWLFFKPSKPYDVYAAALGAGILLVNELMSAFKQNTSLKDRKDRIEYEGLDEDGQVDVSQKQMLEEEKAALEEIKGTAEDKSKYQKAAAAAFAVASGIAFVQGNGELVQAQACAAAVNARAKTIMALEGGAAACFNTTAAGAKAPMTACEATAVTTENIEALKLQPGESATQYTLLTELITVKESSKQTCTLGGDTYAATQIKECEAKIKATTKAAAATGPGAAAAAALLVKLNAAYATIQTANGALVGTKATLESACLMHTKETVKNSGQSKGIDKVSEAKPSAKAGFYASLLSLLISKAQAGNYGSLIGALGGLIAAYKLPVGTAMDTFMLSSIKRGTLWIAMSGTSLASAKAMESEADAIQKNIDKIDAILAKFRSADSVTSAQAKTLQKKTTMLSAYTPQQIGEQVECIGGLPKIATNNGSKACPNAKKYIVSGTDKLNAAGFSMPDSLVGSLVNAANGIQDTSSVSPTTQEAFDALGSSANALNKKANAVMKKTLERAQKANKKKPVAKNLLASFGRKFGGLNKRAGGTGGLMSALPYLSQPNQGSNFGNDDEEEELQDGLAVDAKGGKGLDAAGAANNGGFKFDFGEGAADQYALQKNSEFAANADAVAAMEEDGEGEIIEDSNVDIWQAISVRYKKTAYDRLLKRIE
ncbi:hypothetical protein [Halobacteriovorax sp. RT-2-4]|uniref:hypothetical protein n=1 Tax=unclassified Halobacteriovorax TaxID=2639665 RepID=UPI00399A2B23